MRGADLSTNQAGGRELVDLGPHDIDAIMAVERSAFDASIQADRETVLHRFALGHRMLGATYGGELSGTIGFSSVLFGDDGLDGLPPTFKAYSTQPVPTGANAVCIYSLGIAPSARGITSARMLIEGAFDYGRRNRFTDVIADGPVPSYAGNDQVEARPAVRRMIDDYARTGRFPAQEDFLQDPVLALYHRLTGCRFAKLVAGFLPDDTASGGWRVFLHREL